MSASIEAHKHGATDEAADWSRASLTELCDHIEETHHQYLIKELPRLGALVEKVAHVHGPSHPELSHVKEVFVEMSRELLEHLQKEERVLFPLIRVLESDAGDAPAGSITGPIQRMESEHQASNDDLKSLRELTGGYVPPADACATYSVMLGGLARLEADLHRHFHKENEILFPRAIGEELHRRSR